MGSSLGNSLIIMRQNMKHINICISIAKANPLMILAGDIQLVVGSRKTTKSTTTRSDPTRSDPQHDVIPPHIHNNAPDAYT